MDNATEQLGEGVWRISVSPYLNAFLIAADGHSDAGGLTLVDCGTKRSGPRLVRSIRLLGFDPTSINDIVLTHWHADHMGSAARFASSTAAPKVHVGARDLEAVQGTDRHPHRSAPPGDLFPSGRLAAPFARPGPPVDASAIHDGAVLPFAQNARVIDAPGHTRGHVALLVGRVLIAGDAVMNLLGLTLGFRAFTSGRSSEADTLRTLADLDFDVLAVGHGPPVVSEPQAKLQRLVAKAERRRPAAA